MAGDRPVDGDVPPDEHGHHRDGQGGGSLAETRTRQEYYVALQRTLAMRQSVTKQRFTAEEQAASEKWDEDESGGPPDLGQVQAEVAVGGTPTGRRIRRSIGLLAWGPRASPGTLRQRPSRIFV